MMSITTMIFPSILLLFIMIGVHVHVQSFVIAPLPLSNQNHRHSNTNPITKPTHSHATYTTKLHLKDENLTPEQREQKVEKATIAMTKFSNTYLKNTNTKLCKDLSIPAVVIKGLAEHKVSLGAPLCPCRYYEDKEKEVKEGYWNCPCVPMREEKVCHCMLFLTEDNAFAGDRTEITLEEVKEHSSKIANDS